MNCVRGKEDFLFKVGIISKFVVARHLDLHSATTKTYKNMQHSIGAFPFRPRIFTALERLGDSKDSETQAQNISKSKLTARLDA